LFSRDKRADPYPWLSALSTRTATETSLSDTTTIVSSQFILHVAQRR